MHLISVTPMEGGWAVRALNFDNEMVFLSGARAEAAARRLASVLAKSAGSAVAIEIRLRDGALGGRFFAYPALTAG